MKKGSIIIKKRSMREDTSIFHRYKLMESKYNKLKEDNKKFSTPDNLTIVTVHNYKEVPYFIKGLNLLKLNYVELKIPEGEWVSAKKIPIILKFMKASNKKTKYILCCDARDVIIMDDPKNIIKIFENNFDCDLLFNSTMHFAWACMPEKLEWFEGIGKKGGRYLNAGVFFGDWDFTIEVLGEASKYVTPFSLTDSEYLILGRNKTHKEKLLEVLPNFPEGSSDQDIFKYIHPKFYPRMDIDYANELVYRN